MGKIKLSFVILQPPIEGKIPFDKDYLLQGRIAIKSLINTGFPAKDVISISNDEKYLKRLEKDFGITTYVGPPGMPKEFNKLLKKRPKKRTFYKVLSFASCLPRPLDNCRMGWCDVDVVWKRNPTKLLLEQKVDVWTAQGRILPRKRDDGKKEMHRPGMNYKDLKEFYWENGGGGMAFQHLKYGWKLPKRSLSSNMVCVQPSAYAKLVETWHEMAMEAIQRDDFEKGDQEVMSAAIWRLGLSFDFYGKAFNKGYCLHNHQRQMIKKEYRRLWGDLPI